MRKTVDEAQNSETTREAATSGAERNAIRRYKRRAAQADALDEVALGVQIGDLIVDETRHAEEMERTLTDWKT